MRGKKGRKGKERVGKGWRGRKEREGKEEAER